MCQVAVYLDEEKIMDNVIWVKPVGDGILARTFFEEPVHVRGKLEGIDLIKNRVLVTSSKALENGE